MAGERHGEPSRGAAGRQQGAAVRNLGLATGAFALCFTAWGLISPLARRFEDDLDLSSMETAVLVAVPVVLGSLLRLPAGWLADRFGGRVTYAALLALSAPPAILLGYADSYWALVAVGLLLGVAGASFAVGIPFVAGWFPKERQGFAVGVYGMGNIGTAIAAFGAPVVVDHLGRPALGWGVGVLLLAAAAVFYAGARDAPGRAATPPRYREVVRAAGVSTGSRSSTS